MCVCVFYLIVSYTVQINIFTFYSTYLTQFAKTNKHIFIHSYFTTLLYLTSALQQQQQWRETETKPLVLTMYCNTILLSVNTLDIVYLRLCRGRGPHYTGRRVSRRHVIITLSRASCFPAVSRQRHFNCR